jgi:hypothetical protein
MRWRVEKALGYRFTHPFELKNTKGNVVYHMIFATDSDAGTRIMSTIYANAAKRLPDMLQEARDRISGQQALDLGVEVGGSDVAYRYEPPWEPRT